MLETRAYWFHRGRALLTLGENLLKGLQDRWRPINYRTKTWRNRARLTSFSRINESLKSRYLSVKSKIGRKALRRRNRFSNLLTKTTRTLAPNKRGYMAVAGDLGLRLAAANIYVYVMLRHLQITGERVVAEDNLAKVSGYERRSFLTFNKTPRRRFLYLALAQAGEFETTVSK